MTCKGICARYKAHKPAGAGRYSSGQVRCQICEIFIKHEGLWCPCCGYRLRTKPRNLKYKKILREGKPVIPKDNGLERVSVDSSFHQMEQEEEKAHQEAEEFFKKQDEGMWLHDCKSAKMIISTYGDKCTHCKITKKEALAA